MTPPTTGPSVDPRYTPATCSPRAFPRLSIGCASVTIATVHEKSIATAAPCNSLRTISTEAEGASAAASERTVKATIPIPKNRLRPTKSAMRPAGMRRAAPVSM